MAKWNAGVARTRGWLKAILCQHPVEHLTFVENIYGDRINVSGGMRSIWRCRDCGKDIFRPDLFTPSEQLK